MEELYLHLRQEQDARVQRANSAPLPTCCEFHGHELGCREGKDCPEGRISFAGDEPTSWDWFYDWCADMGCGAKTLLWWMLGAVVVSVVLYLVVKGLTPHWAVVVAKMGV
jgi:hypothetical protein